MSTIYDAFLHHFNQEVPSFSFDGKFYRKDSLWSVGSEFVVKGNVYYFATFGDWKTGEKHTWSNYDPKAQSKHFLGKAKEAIDQVIAIQNFEAEKKHADCKQKWFPIFHAMPEKAELHAYMSGKKLVSNHIARINPENNGLFIPVYDLDGFVGCQIIFANDDGGFEKRFTTGIRMRGSFTGLGDFKNADFLYLCEGFATGCTIFEVTQKPVVVAFNCHNLDAVISNIRKINPKCKIIICADNDHERKNNQTGKMENIGIIKARNAKKLASNCVIKVPDFGVHKSGMSDFNDLYCIVGADETRNQLIFSYADFVTVHTLGRQGKKFFYYSTETRQVLDLSPTEHTKNNFLTMAGSFYWGDVYGWKRNEEGEQRIGHVNWDQVIERVIEEQRAQGFFNPKNVRGFGCWIDEARTVVNLGDRFLLDGEIAENFETKYLYESNDPLVCDVENPLTVAECKKIIDLFKKLSFKNEGDFIYIVAWIAQAQIFGGLDWRFMVWLTGPRGSGKTEVLKMISKLVFNGEIYQSITSASIRQHLKSNAMPMIIDEAEPNNQETRRKMDAVIELIRQCSRRINTKTIRGTASGDALEYNVNSVFLLSSIQSYLPTMADYSRFFEVELTAEHNADWKQLQKDFEEIQNFGPRLFSRMIKQLPHIKANFNTIRDLLIKSELITDSRLADQIGTTMACFVAMLIDGELKDHDLIVQIAKRLNLGQSSYEVDNDANESENCLNDILETIVDNQMKRTIADLLENGFGDEILWSYGIKKVSDGLFIQTGNVELRSLVNRTMYHNLKAILKRHPSFEREIVVRQGTQLKKGLLIKM